jgi:hypothetical protein
MSRDDWKEAAMATIKAVDFERCGIARGIKTAAFVLVLTAGALAADHVFFVAPKASPAAVTEVQAATVAPTATDGFKLPDNLRPTAADSATQAPTF